MNRFTASVFACLAMLFLAKASPGDVDPWIAYMTPLAEHAKLERFTGSWNVAVSIWLSPDNPPQVFSMKAEAEMVLGGRYHRTKIIGMTEGMVFEEVAFLGFNNATAKFTRTALHTLGTGQLVVTGTWAEPDRVIELNGEAASPVTRQPIKVRQRITFVDLNTILLENFDQPAGGPEAKTMEQRLTRAAVADK